VVEFTITLSTIDPKIIVHRPSSHRAKKDSPNWPARDILSPRTMVSRCLRSEFFVLRRNTRIIRRDPWIIARTIQSAGFSSSSAPLLAPFSTPPTPSSPPKRLSKSAKKPQKLTATLEPSPIFASFNVPKFDPTKRPDGKNLTVQKKKQSQPLTTAQQTRRKERDEARKAIKPQDEKSVLPLSSPYDPKSC
jgi:hypothetical protein